MTIAKRTADLSVLTRVVARDVEEFDGHWDTEAQAWVFPDGSKGAFTKNAALATRDGFRMFSHYRFEEC